MPNPLTKLNFVINTERVLINTVYLKHFPFLYVNFYFMMCYIIGNNPLESITSC